MRRWKMKIQRADQSFLFLGDGDQNHGVAPGSLLVLNRDERKIFDAFENAGAPMTDADVAGFCSQTSVYRPGMDVTKAELVSRTNWRRQEKTENVGEWKARVYEIHNVVFSFRSRKVVNNNSSNSNSENDVAAEQVLPLELDEDDDGFFVAEIDTKHRHSSFQPQESHNYNKRNNFQQHRHSSFQESNLHGHRPPRNSSFQETREEWVSVGRRSVDVYPSLTTAPRKAVVVPGNVGAVSNINSNVQTKEKEYVRSLRPSVWLTEQFPLKTEELLPLLDILANKVKAVRRMRELLTTKFPPGTFPVKVAIPVVPTVRVVITFTKFVELQPTEQFYTPLSSPRHFTSGARNSSENEQKPDSHHPSSSSSTSFFSWSSSSTSSSGSAWLRRNSSQSSGSGSKHQQQQSASSSSMAEVQLPDPFAIPSGYTWSSVDDKSNKMKRSKSTRKSK